MVPRFWSVSGASLALLCLSEAATSGTIRTPPQPAPPPTDSTHSRRTGGAAATPYSTTRHGLTSIRHHPRRGTTAAGWLAERSSRATPPAKTSGRAYRLATDFGADPSGHADASDAFDAALAELWAHPSEAQNDWMMPDGAIIAGPDLGGAVLDLEGGTYGVSRPVRFPSAGGGNMFLRGGTIRALPGFAASASNCSTCTVKPELEGVVEVGGGPAVHMIGRVVIEDLTIDGSGIVHGGLKMTWCTACKVSLCNVVGFTSIGIYAGPAGGGFVDIIDSYVGTNRQPGATCPHSPPSNKGPPPMNSTAVWIDMNDSFMTGCYLHCSGLGLALRGSVNTIVNVHAATNWHAIPGGGVWSQSGATNNRLIGCYMDGATLVVDDPNNFMYTNGYFLGVGGESSAFPLLPLAMLTCALGVPSRAKRLACWAGTDRNFVTVRLTKAGVGVHGLHLTDNQVEAGSGEWITVAAVDGGSLNTNAAEMHSNVVTGNGEVRNEHPHSILV